MMRHGRHGSFLPYYLIEMFSEKGLAFSLKFGKLLGLICIPGGVR